MPITERIRTEHYVEALVAGDTFDLIAARVRRLLSHRRRLSMTQRYTWVGDAPALHAGLEVFDIQQGVDWLHVRLTPGLDGFGLAGYAHEGNATEDESWKRYHAAKAESEDFFERRRNMTLVELSGGREQDGPGRDDRIVIRAWNSDGVCDERVIAFEAAR
jgi:hypothetical protein